MASTNPLPKFPGTTPFDGEQAQKGYALNKMCFSFNSGDNRAEFLKDEEAYMRKYQLTPPQAAAIRARNVLQLIAAGGNAYYLAKFAGIFGLDIQRRRGLGHPHPAPVQGRTGPVVANHRHAG